jgi:hypothetical protein
VDSWTVDGESVPAAPADVEIALKESDLAIVLAGHREYEPGLLAEHAPLLFDTRGRTHALGGDSVELL